MVKLHKNTAVYIILHFYIDIVISSYTICASQQIDRLVLCCSETLEIGRDESQN